MKTRLKPSVLSVLRQKLEAADLVLFVVDAADGVTERDQELYQSFCGSFPPGGDQ